LNAGMTNEDMNEIINEYINHRRVTDRLDSATFLAWFLEIIFGIDQDIAISAVCDNKNDKGIDAIYVDPIEEEIHIFQSKLKNKSEKTIGDKYLRDFSGVMPWFEDSNSIGQLQKSLINPELKSLIEENDLINIIDDYEVKFHFVINAIRDINTNEYLKVSPNIELWCLERLRNYYTDIKDDPYVSDKITFNNIDNENVILLENVGSYRMITFPMLASDLISLRGIDDFTLFNNNVRYGLGNTRVNKSIKSTLKNNKENEKFIMFHNGISIVCDLFDYDPNKKTLTIENYSIVNGAQSTITFFNNSSLLSGAIKVFVKLIQVEKNQELSDLVTYYNNNQNSISMRDLRSNDNAQKRLIHQFEKLRKNFGVNVGYYPKRGNRIPETIQPIFSDYAAQLINSCYLQRPYDSHKKSSMFDSGYTTIFNRNVTATRILIYYIAHQCLLEKVNLIKDQRIATFNLAQFFLLNTLFQIIEKEPRTSNIFSDAEHYIDNQETFRALINLLLTSLINVANHSVDELKTDESFVYKNFFKSKEKVSKLKTQMINYFTTSLSLSGRTYNEICTEAGIP